MINLEIGKAKAPLTIETIKAWNYSVFFMGMVPTNPGGNATCPSQPSRSYMATPPKPTNICTTEHLPGDAKSTAQIMNFSATPKTLTSLIASMMTNTFAVFDRLYRRGPGHGPRLFGGLPPYYCDDNKVAQL